MAMKLTEKEKAYDNMLRQLNSDIKRAYTTLGSNSQQYKNLVILGTSLGLKSHANADGMFQYDRNRKQLSNMTDNQLSAIKEQYYHHDSKGNLSKDKMKKNIINREYNVTSKANQVKQDAMKYFNTKRPTKQQTRYMSEKDILVSEFWYQYNESQDNATDDDENPNTIRFHAYQDVANKIYAGYDIENKPQSDSDFNRLHNLVTQALAQDNNRLVANVDNYMADTTTGEILGEITPEIKSVFDADYFDGDDWTDILI